MNFNKPNIVIAANNVLDSILQGKIPEKLDPDEFVGEEIYLAQSCNNLITTVSEIGKFILPLSRGEFEKDIPPSGNFLVSPFKELHSRLRQLIWQAEQVAKGDYRQRIDFMGDFSASFNNMVEALEQKEKSLKNNLRQLELLYEVNPNALLSIDFNFKITKCNGRATEISGYDEDEVIGKDIFFFSDSSEENELLIKMIQLHKSFRNKELFLKCKDGSGKNILVNANVIDVENEKSGIIVSFEDITDRKLAEETLKKYAKELEELNNNKDKFFSVISHDLRSPFTALIGLSQVLAINIEEFSDEEIRNISNDLYRSAKSVYALLDNILQWVKLQQGRISVILEPLNLCEVADEAIESVKLIAEKKDLSIFNDISSNFLVTADRNMILLVFRNLISNAIKFTPVGRDIFLYVEPGANEEEIICVVEDNGIGIMEEIQKKLFRIDENISSPGTQNERGSGLGLILCKDFIEKNNGKIWFETKPGKGSKFKFTLKK